MARVNGHIHSICSSVNTSVPGFPLVCTQAGKHGGKHKGSYIEGGVRKEVEWD